MDGSSFHSLLSAPAFATLTETLFYMELWAAPMVFSFSRPDPRQSWASKTKSAKCPPSLTSGTSQRPRRRLVPASCPSPPCAPPFFLANQLLFFLLASPLFVDFCRRFFFPKRGLAKTATSQFSYIMTMWQIPQKYATRLVCPRCQRGRKNKRRFFVKNSPCSVVRLNNSPLFKQNNLHLLVL